MTDLRKLMDVANDKAINTNWRANQAAAEVVKAESILAAWRREVEYRAEVALVAQREAQDATSAWAHQEAEKAVTVLEQMCRDEVKS